MNNSDLITLAMLFGFITGTFWMVIGWRAMRAHERLADASEQAAKSLRENVILTQKAP